MRGYDRNEMHRTDDLDYYEEDEEEQEEAEVEEEYEEEQEDPQPSKEEVEYLELRQKLKEAVRKQMKKENGASFGKSQEKKKTLPYDNYGSFFGPSQPVIAQRVIQESKSLLENQHLAARISNSSHVSKKIPTSTNAETRPGGRDPPPKVVNESLKTKYKAQKLKDMRDYSFLLSEDSELPAPRRVPSPRNVSVPNSDARSAQVQSKSRQLLSNNSRPSLSNNSRQSLSNHSRQSLSNHSRPFSNGRDERKSLPTNGQMQSKAAHHQVASGSRRPNMTSTDARKQLGSNTGNGPGRPMGPKPSKIPAPSKVPTSNKFSALTVDKKASLVGSRKPISSMQKTPLPKLPSSVQKQHLEQRREIREPEKARLNSKMPAASSKPQIKPPKQIQSRASMQVDRPKKRPVGSYFDEDDEEDPQAIIRKMFGYDPRKYAGVDEDDSDMEANFDDILLEEKRSEKIAREEDERELRLIEEEERRERLRKEAKRRKLSQR